MACYMKTESAKKLMRRFYSIKNRPNYVTAKNTRQQFLDFFIKENSYNFVKSSPVVPLHDASVPFVNAGMYQFKSVFLNQQNPPYTKVANSQKCIRIGGKHNDLEAVGQDGYHHTFFEMLGSWTFRSCSKDEACRLAWKLLTEIYMISPNHLYVTYFGGNKDLNLPPDEECRDVWRNLGIPAGRILPFGMQENFWEMGVSGPCGPCTEIHFDHLGTPKRAAFVNKGLHELIELWNIVFIEYHRDQNGSIKPLPEKHVDTGLGFERLVAVLQSRISNYDTDVFKYLFDAINKNCPNAPKYKSLFGEKDWSYLHTNYRILADHARMITISLGDGIIPEQNQKLRRVMRRAFFICENTFKVPKGLLKELSNYVIDNLGPVYPELEANSKHLHQMIDYEEEVYQQIRKSASKEWARYASETPMLNNLDILEMPGLVQAYKEIKNKPLEKITPEFAYKLYDTYGMEEEAITKLCTALDIKFNPQDFRDEFARMKTKSKQGSLQSNYNILSQLVKDLKVTEDAKKYDYTRNANGTYEFKPLEVQILKIITNGKCLESLGIDTECALVLDKTNLYKEEGGQHCDTGIISFSSNKLGKFHVKSTKQVNNCLLHMGTFHSEIENAKISVSQKGSLCYDTKLRLDTMRNHTATHLLNAVLKEFKGATCQKSSKVTDKSLNFDVGIFTSGKLSVQDVFDIENRINKYINEKLDVQFLNVDSAQLLKMDAVTLIPGEIYPDQNIRMVEILAQDQKVVSREPCCGTHVFNTGDINKFHMVSLKSLGRSTISLHAVTGDRAIKAHKNGQKFIEKITEIERNYNEKMGDHTKTQEIISALRNQLQSSHDDENVIPLLIKYRAAEKLDNLSRKIREKTKNNIKNLIDNEMRRVLQEKLQVSERQNKFAVHFLRSSLISDHLPLQKATEKSPDVPVMVIALNEDHQIIKATCRVPTTCANENFTADKWMQVVAEELNGSIHSPKGHTKEIVCNFKGKKKSTGDESNKTLNKTLQIAEEFARKNL